MDDLTDILSLASPQFLITLAVIILGVSICSFFFFKILFSGSKTKLCLIDGLYATNFLIIAVILPLKVKGKKVDLKIKGSAGLVLLPLPNWGDRLDKAEVPYSRSSRGRRPLLQLSQV